MGKVRFRRDKELRPLSKAEKASLIIRSVLALLLLAGAIVAITFGVRGCVNMNPGYYVIEGDTDEDVPSYDDGSLKLTFYFNENDKESYREVTNIYSTALRTSYASTSKLNHFNGYTSIYDINNASYGTEIECSAYLYKTLKDAYSYSETYTNYSLFNAPLYDYWEHLFTLGSEKAINNDPFNNAENKSYLEDLMAIINDKNNYSLSFNDSNLTVRLTISDTYQNFINTRYNYSEMKFPVISFNIIEEALKVSHLSSALIEKGYTKGFITTNDGLLTTLGGLNDIQYNVLDYINEESYRDIGYVSFENKSVVASFRRFETTKRLYSPFYSFVKDNETIYRSSYINTLTGYPTQYFANSNVYSRSEDIVGASLMNNELILADNLEKTKEVISKESFNNYFLAFTCFSNEKTIYLTKNLKDFITIKDKLDYNLIEL